MAAKGEYWLTLPTRQATLPSPFRDSATESIFWPDCCACWVGISERVKYSCAAIWSQAKWFWSFAPIDPLNWRVTSFPPVSPPMSTLPRPREEAGGKPVATAGASQSLGPPSSALAASVSGSMWLRT
jgi:hypothetical protein